MPKILTIGLLITTLHISLDMASAQQKNDLAIVIQKLDDIEKRIDEMDKKYEIRFIKLEAEVKSEFKRIDERFNTIETKFDGKFDAVNQRIDDKFNLIVGLLMLIAAFLALPYLPKLLERYKARAERREDIQRLQEQIDQIKTKIS